MVEVVSQAGCEVSPAVASFLEGGEKEEDFPALPPANGTRVAGAVPSPPAMTRLGSLDYSALAERLAIETAAAAASAAAEAAANPSGAAGGGAGGTISRLSVLPGFGDVRRGDAKLRGTSSDDPPGSAESQVWVVVSSNGLMNAAGNAGGNPVAPGLRSWSAHEEKHFRAGAETVALRARLRERWFRLEAAREAQRQRESAERALMAAEDGGVVRHERGGGAEGSGGRVGRVGRRSRLADPVDVADDGGKSGAGRDSSGTGNTSSSSGGISDRERPSSSSSGMTTAVKANHEASCPSGIKASDVSVETDDPSASTAERIKALSPKPRAVSAAGIAAIRRSEAAAAAVSVAAAPSSTETIVSTGPGVAPLANKDLSAQHDSDRTDVPGITADSDDPAGASSGLLEIDADKVDAAPCEGDEDSGGVPSLHGERVHEACEAGMAGLLNDLLVRSGGGVADGKDKVRRKRKRSDTLVFSVHFCRAISFKHFVLWKHTRERGETCGSAGGACSLASRAVSRARSSRFLAFPLPLVCEWFMF